MRYKKGQLTTFILIGLLVIILILASLFITKQVNKKIIAQDIWGKKQSSDLLTMQITNCLENTERNGLYFISSQGGYYNVTGKKERFSDISVPYYVYLKDKYYLSKEVLEAELAKYIKYHIADCIKELSGIGYANLTTNNSNIDVNVLMDKSTVVQLYYPIPIKVQENTISLNKFDSEVNFNLLSSYILIEKFIKKHDGEMPLSYLSTLAYENNFTYNIINLDSNSIMYSFIFKDDKDNSFAYNFMVKYNWSEYEVKNERAG